MSKINPFGKAQVERSPIDIMQESFGIGIKQYDRGSEVWDEDAQKWVWSENLTNECVIEFSVNEGKGTGRQTIPASEFKDYVGVLQGIIDAGFREPEGADRTAYVPTNVIAAQSFKMVAKGEGGDRNLVSVRSTSGKGAKPMMVPRQQFAQVVAALRQIADSLPDFEQQAWDNYNGESNE
jgi:hypothetical protein